MTGLARSRGMGVAQDHGRVECIVLGIGGRLPEGAGSAVAVAGRTGLSVTKLSIPRLLRA